MLNTRKVACSRHITRQKPQTPPRPPALKAVEDPALNALNEPLTHSVLAHDDGAEHLGDVGGAHLDTDLSFFAKSRIEFTPAQRVALTANGNLQRVLSAYHNERVTIRVLSHERESLGLWRRRVVLELADRPACVARSSVVARTRTAIEKAQQGGGLGQLFSEVIYPPLCFTASDSELWESDPQEYVLSLIHI